MHVAMRNSSHDRYSTTGVRSLFVNITVCYNQLPKPRIKYPWRDLSSSLIVQYAAVLLGEYLAGCVAHLLGGDGAVAG